LTLFKNHPPPPRSDLLPPLLTAPFLHRHRKPLNRDLTHYKGLFVCRSDELDNKSYPSASENHGLDCFSQNHGRDCFVVRQACLGKKPNRPLITQEIVNT
jgi:hypothetical protein